MIERNEHAVIGVTLVGTAIEARCSAKVSPCGVTSLALAVESRQTQTLDGVITFPLSLDASRKNEQYIVRHMYIPEPDFVIIYIRVHCLIYDPNTVCTNTCSGTQWMYSDGGNQSSHMNRNRSSRHHGVTADGAAQGWSHPRSASISPSWKRNKKSGGTCTYMHIFVSLGMFCLEHENRHKHENKTKRKNESTTYILFSGG